MSQLAKSIKAAGIHIVQTLWPPSHNFHRAQVENTATILVLPNLKTNSTILRLSLQICINTSQTKTKATLLTTYFYPLADLFHERPMKQTPS